MMPNRHSLFWRLALLLVAFFLLSVWLSWTWGRSAELKGYYLSAEARASLEDYARRAEQAWLDGGRAGVDRWLAEPRQRALDWVVVLDGRLQSLGSRPLTEEEAERLTFLRGIDWPMSSRSLSRPFMNLRFPGHPRQGRVVLRLPAEFVPPGLSPAKRLVTHGLVPAGLALLLGVLLYRRWIVPLGRLRAQANALRGNDLTARTQPRITRRSDELGDLGRAFDHMAERLDEHMVLQRQLLRDLSHELRTPLARLQVAAESELSTEALRARLEQEVQGMQQLVDNALGWPGSTPSARRWRWRISPCRHCGTCWWRTPVSKAAGPPNACAATCPKIAWSAATSMAWPRPWKTCCATRSAIPRREVWSASTVSAKAHAGACAWKTRARASPRSSWKPSSAPSPVSPRRGPARVSVSA